MKKEKVEKKPVATPSDQISFRVNDPTKPEHADLFRRFMNILDEFGGDRSTILRANLSAYCDCVERHGRLPRLPLKVESAKK